MKKIICVFLSIMLISVFAVATLGTEGKTDIIRISDYEFILSEEEISSLGNKLNDIYDTYGLDIFCVLTEGASDDYMYSFNIYNQAIQNTERTDAIIVVISVDNNVCSITPFGSASDILSEEAGSSAKELAVKSVESQNYYEAFNTIIRECEKYLKDSDYKAPENNEVLNTENAVSEEKNGNWLIKIIVPLVIVVVVILATLLIFRKKTKGKKK